MVHAKGISFDSFACLHLSKYEIIFGRREGGRPLSGGKASRTSLFVRISTPDMRLQIANSCRDSLFTPSSWSLALKVPFLQRISLTRTMDETIDEINHTLESVCKIK